MKYRTPVEKAFEAFFKKDQSLERMHSAQGLTQVVMIITWERKFKATKQDTLYKTEKLSVELSVFPAIPSPYPSKKGSWGVKSCQFRDKHVRKFRKGI